MNWEDIPEGTIIEAIFIPDDGWDYILKRTKIGWKSLESRYHRDMIWVVDNTTTYGAGSFHNSKYVFINHGIESSED